MEQVLRPAPFLEDKVQPSQKQIIVKDFQAWVIKQKHGWSGTADVWIGAYDFYDIDELKRIKKLYEEEVERNQQLLVANGNMRLLLSENGIEHEN